MRSIIDNFKEGVTSDTIIKIVGVGGGGGNAVANMFEEGIRGVSYLAINTDKAALSHMPFSHRLQIGEGLGAGNDPEVAAGFAEKAADEIREALDDGTKMVFITAGMGGGTGTGASPVVARIARSLGILTVGIVTLPFAYEMPLKLTTALKGISTFSENVDALIVVNNEKLTTIEGFVMSRAFKEADNVLLNAAKSIADIVNIDGYINADFNDVRNCLTDGQKTVISTGRARGNNRTYDAIQDALNSDLVSTDNIMESKKVVLNFYCSSHHEITTIEISKVTEFMYQMSERDSIWVKSGYTFDDTLGDEVRVTILAAGSGKICPEEYRKEYEWIKKQKELKERQQTKDAAPAILLDLLNDDDDLLKDMRNTLATDRLAVEQPSSDE